MTQAELEGAYLANALVTLHGENWGVYGVRKLWHAARRAGLQVGRDQVGRLMGIAGIADAGRGRLAHPGHRLFLLTTRGCFHNPGRERTRVIGEARVSSPVRQLDPLLTLL